MADRTDRRYVGRTVGVAVLRAVTAAGVLLSADIHLEMWASGFRNIPVIGPLFLLNTAGGLVLGIALLAGRYRLVALAAAGFGAATLAAFTVSATVGLFGVRESLAGVPERMSVLAEAVAVVGGLTLAALPARAARPETAQPDPTASTRRAVPADRAAPADGAALPDRGVPPAGTGGIAPGRAAAPGRAVADADADADAVAGNGGRAGHGWRHGARLGR